MTSVLVCPSDDVTEMASALGLDPKRVTALTMRIRPGHLVTVHVQLILGPEEGRAISTKWKRFALTPLPDKS